MTKVEHLTEVQKLDSRVLLGGYVDDLLSRWSTLFVGGLRAPYIRVCYISLRNTTEQKRVDSHHPQDISSTRHWCFQACFEKGIHRKLNPFFPGYKWDTQLLPTLQKTNGWNRTKSNQTTKMLKFQRFVFLWCTDCHPFRDDPSTPRGNAPPVTRLFLCDWKATTEELQGPPRCQYVPGFVSNAVLVTGVKYAIFVGHEPSL